MVSFPSNKTLTKIDMIDMIQEMRIHRKDMKKERKENLSITFKLKPWSKYISKYLEK